MLAKVREIKGLLHDQVVSTGLVFILAGIIQKIVEEVIILILLLLIWRVLYKHLVILRLHQDRFVGWWRKFSLLAIHRSLDKLGILALKLQILLRLLHTGLLPLIKQLLLGGIGLWRLLQVCWRGERIIHLFSRDDIKIK